ncbi:MAG: hypothetical protein GC192_05080 [Bacteroidetes bacterium]|nr:hypothetical protein [Bacteroidota bacterium]
MENRISIIITDADQADILSKIQNVDGSMPWLITLDKDEVVGDLKLDKDSTLYLDKTVNIINQKDDLVSADKKAEFIKDVNFYRNMMPVALAHEVQGNKIRKTMIRVGQEINAVFREVYTTLQIRAKHDSSYQTYLDELAPYFKKFGRKGSSRVSDTPK